MGEAQAPVLVEASGEASDEASVQAMAEVGASAEFLFALKHTLGNV